MKRDDNTPMRSRTIQEEIYADAGTPNHAFSVPQPFSVTDAMVALAEEVGANATGLANQLNQVLAENLGNNMSSRIKKAAKNKTDLPTQDDMLTLYDSYDFTGIRSSAAAFGSMFDKILYRLSNGFIRTLILKKGYQDMPAPVKVARRGAEAADGQIDFETFEGEVLQLMEGQGPWGEKEAFIDIRENLIAEARAEEERTKASAEAAESQLAAIDLS